MSILNCGIIGLGNAGGQIANDATNLNFKALCMNVSEADLNLLGKADTIVIGDSMGSGKDRDIAKAYIKKHIKELISKDSFSEFINACHVVFIISSTAGGSGSGMAPLLTDVLSSIYKNVNFINVGIMPTYTESVKSQRNSMDYVKEIVDFNATYMLYDNNNFSDLPPKEMMLAVNKDVIEDLCILRGDYNIISPYGMIDGKDMTKIISVPGMIRIPKTVGFVEKDLDKSSIEELLIKDIATGVGCEIERDRIVKRMGVIVNINKDTSRFFNSSLKKFIEYAGEPIDSFEHYYEFDSSETHLKNRVCVVMSGLSVPDDRLKKIDQRIKEAEERLSRKKESTVLGNYNERTSFINIDVDKSTKGINEDELDDILGKY